MKKCKECSKEFEAKNPRRVYCTERCRCVYKSKKARVRNKKRIREQRKILRLSRKDGVYVYQLSCGYVGVTDNLLNRMSIHRHVGRDTKDYIVLAKCPTREEALDIEALYQSINNLKIDNARRLRYIL